MRQQQDDRDAEPIDGDRDAIGPPPAATAPNGATRITGWVASGAVHAAALMLMGTIYVLAVEQEVEIPPMRVQPPPIPERRPEVRRERRDLLDPQRLVVESVATADAQPTADLALPDELMSSEEDSTDTAPKGTDEAVASIETGGQGAFLAIGANSGGSGSFGLRHGGKRRAVATGGGSIDSEEAVKAALRWFKRHQAADGAWRATTYQDNCTMDGPKCEPGRNHRNGANEDIALTALATLCFLGAGYDYATPNQHRQVVRKAIDWLRSTQDANGQFGAAYNYEQAIAAMALAEAYAMTNDRSLRPSAQRAIDVVLARRAKPTPLIGSGAGGTGAVSGLGWGDHTATGTRAHTSACGWNIQALKSAATAGLDVQDGPDGARLWLEALWRGTCALENKDPAQLDPYRDTTTLAYYIDFASGSADALGAANRIHNLAAIGVVSGVFMGMDAGSPMIQTMANHVMRYDLPRDWPGNLYYTYYATFGIFQLGGERWRAWNSVVRDRFVHSQRTDEGCFDGSWDFERTTFYASDVGRLLSTALSCLSLEVYYRYAQAHARDGRAERKTAR